MSVSFLLLDGEGNYTFMPLKTNELNNEGALNWLKQIILDLVWSIEWKTSHLKKKSTLTSYKFKLKNSIQYA